MVNILKLDFILLIIVYSVYISGGYHNGLYSVYISGGYHNGLYSVYISGGYHNLFCVYFFILFCVYFRGLS